MKHFLAVLTVAILGVGGLTVYEAHDRAQTRADAVFMAAVGEQSLQRAADSVWVIETPKGPSSAVKIGEDTFLTALHVLVEGKPSRLSHPSLIGDARFKAHTVYVDEKVDLAIVKTERRLEGPAALIGSASPSAGAKVVVVGYPLGMRARVISEGYASDRVESTTVDRGKTLLTSAQVTHGNSGGGLFYKNSAGVWVLAGITHVVRTVKSNYVWHLSLFIPAETIAPLIDCAVFEVKASCHHDINSLSYKR